MIVGSCAIRVAALRRSLGRSIAASSASVNESAEVAVRSSSIAWARPALASIKRFDVRRERAFRELLVKRVELLARRQLALEQEVRDLFVRRVRREVRDVVAAVHEDPLVGIDRADRRLGNDDSGQLDGLLGRHRQPPISASVRGGGPM